MIICVGENLRKDYPTVIICADENLRKYYPTVIICVGENLRKYYPTVIICDGENVRFELVYFVFLIETDGFLKFSCVNTAGIDKHTSL